MLKVTARQRADEMLVSTELRFRWDHCVAAACCDCGSRNPTLKVAMYKPLSRIAAPGSRC